jgi:hypothetical protein
VLRGWLQAGGVGDPTPFLASGMDWLRPESRIPVLRGREPRVAVAMIDEDVDPKQLMQAIKVAVEAHG